MVVFVCFLQIPDHNFHHVQQIHLCRFVLFELSIPKTQEGFRMNRLDQCGPDETNVNQM